MLQDAAGLEQIMRIATLAILSALLASMRFAGLFVTFPLFTRLELPPTISTPVALALSLPVAMAIYATLEKQPDFAFGMFFLIAVKELAVGAMLGIVLGVPFFAASGAGDLIDQYRGASAPNTFDPVNAAEVSTLGSLLGILSIALFVVAGGFLATVGVVYTSYAIWPVMDAAPRVAMDAAKALGDALTSILRLSFVLAAPPLVVMLIIDILFLFVERAARRFNVFELTTTVKNLTIILLAPVYAGFFGYYLQAEWRTLLNGINRFFNG